MNGVDLSQASGRDLSLGVLTERAEGAAGTANAPSAPIELDRALGVLLGLVGHDGSAARAMPKDHAPPASAAPQQGAHEAQTASEPTDAEVARAAEGRATTGTASATPAARASETAATSQTVEIEAPEPDALDPEPPSLMDIIPEDLHGVLLQAAGDPVFCLALLDAAMKQTAVRDGIQDVNHSQRSARDAALERERAIEKAIKKAHRRCHMPKWLRKLVKAIATIASAVVAVMSGGAGAVALAGMVLLLSAKQIGKLAVKLGMDPDKAKWLVVGLQAVGAAMSVVAGGAGATSLASSAAELARSTVNVVGASVEAVGKVIEGGYDIADSVFQEQAAMAQAGADQAGVRFDAASLELDDAVSTLREGLQSLAQGLSVETDVLRLRDEARRATLERAV